MIRRIAINIVSLIILYNNSYAEDFKNKFHEMENEIYLFNNLTNERYVEKLQYSDEIKYSDLLSFKDLKGNSFYDYKDTSNYNFYPLYKNSVLNGVSYIILEERILGDKINYTYNLFLEDSQKVTRLVAILGSFCKKEAPENIYIAGIYYRNLGYYWYNVTYNEVGFNFSSLFGSEKKMESYSDFLSDIESLNNYCFIDKYPINKKGVKDNISKLRATSTVIDKGFIPLFLVLKDSCLLKKLELKFKVDESTILLSNVIDVHELRTGELGLVLLVQGLKKKSLVMIRSNDFFSENTLCGKFTIINKKRLMFR